MSIYTKLKEAGVPLDNHASDLYAKVTPVSTRILHTSLCLGGYISIRALLTFVSKEDGSLWYDLPFAYDPFWEKGRPDEH